MAARSTSITLNNLTSLNLSRTYANLDHGEWTSNSLPPDNIPPQKSASWQAESNGLATGDQGTVKYSLGDESNDVVIAWDNPYAGSNSYSPSVSSSGYKIVQENDGSGNNARVTFTLRKE